jgi:hypothetical protein
MTALFDKLNLGTRKAPCVFNAPASFEAQLQALAEVHVDRDPTKPPSVDFALAFVTTQAELDRLSRLLAKSGEGDVVL